MNHSSAKALKRVRLLQKRLSKLEKQHPVVQRLMAPQVKSWKGDVRTLLAKLRREGVSDFLLRSR